MFSLQTRLLRSAFDAEFSAAKNALARRKSAARLDFALATVLSVAVAGYSWVRYQHAESRKDEAALEVCPNATLKSCSWDPAAPLSSNTANTTTPSTSSTSSPTTPAVVPSSMKLSYEYTNRGTVYESNSFWQHFSAWTPDAVQGLARNSPLTPELQQQIRDEFAQRNRSPSKFTVYVHKDDPSVACVFPGSAPGDDKLVLMLGSLNGGFGVLSVYTLLRLLRIK